MSKKIKVSELPVFDITEHLDNEVAVAAYLTLVIEESDPSELAHALGVVARARGMTQVAKEAGIAREALYKALRSGAQPRFDTVQRVCAALGVKLTAVPADLVLQRIVERKEMSASRISSEEILAVRDADRR